ncbi:hypothetical protein CARG_02935 [Corynebacterium argentoratense DSM 44202]|uniref:Beta-lactamase-related domain-containing protein n=1 Tax=Corynebacterium argentoratense DSM 44202 TaxID=1348662 RepID=U3GTV3_9CORY|nr:hypothetical protein CARG_02935 [Corynebacterium argentoratense DSM 44202]
MAGLVDSSGTSLIHSNGCPPDAPTGRKKGSISCCGLGNLYMWIDPDTGIAGLWATRLLPFFDGPCVAAAEAFEAATYRAIRRR